MKLKLDARTLGLLAALFVLAYAGAGYFMLVSPKKAEAARLDDEIAATNVELMAARAATDAQEDTQPIAVADIFRLATAMPSAPDMPGILLELSRIAEETGVRFKSITPQSSSPLGEFQIVPIEVAFDGSFYALSDFLFRLRTLVSVRRGELHASGRLFSVGRVEFTESEQGFPMLAASLSLKAYVYGTDVPASDVPAPVDPAAAPPAEGAEVPVPSSEAAASGGTG
ncbi:MAG TPA: type 4a pilus biogenesis protein PilO [Gaiellaceae bacterium]|nr:type 4a pilus biogenesis protein PilO [Gaiellaceae bacterium]